MTEIASAVDSVADGDLRVVRWSWVRPARSSRITVTTRRISESAARSAGSSRAAPRLRTRVVTISTSWSRLSGSGSTTVLNRRRSAEDRSLTPLSRLFAVAMTLNPLTRLHFCVEFGDGQGLLAHDGDEGILHVRRDPGELLHPNQAAGLHGPHHRPGHQRRAGRAVGEQPRVVPAVPQRLFRCARGALHHQGGGAGDGRRQVLAEPGLRRARHAEQQQAPVSGK